MERVQAELLEHVGPNPSPVQRMNDERPDADPVADATAIVTAARADVKRLEETEAAMTREIERVQSGLRQRRVDQYAAKSEIICASPEYRALMEAHTEAWKRLRTVKKALAEVVTGCHGQLPQRFMDEPNRSEPLEIRVGFQVDANLVGAWADAMAALELDADAELPDQF